MKQKYQNDSNDIKPLIQSASIILFQDTNKLEKILMIKRVGNISFANHVVFPGGVCDKQDIQVTSQIIGLNKFQDYGKITAIRELFEETKILLLPEKNQRIINQIRKGQIKNLTFQYEFFAKLWKNHMDLLIPLIRLMTIQNLKSKRFDTIFYTPNQKVIKLNLNNPQNPEDLSKILIDKSQSLQYFWERATRILQMTIAKKIILSPPQIIILKCLKRVKNIVELQKLTIQKCYEPIIFQSKNLKTFTLLGDFEYNWKEIIEKQPKSKSKANYQNFILSKMAELIQAQQNKLLRRFQFDLQNKQINYTSSYVQESLLYFLKEEKSSL